jgi:hypothetical protein
VGGLSASATGSESAETPPTPDPSPPRAARVEGGEKNYVAAVVTPPSTTIVWPVMNVDASDAR